MISKKVLVIIVTVILTCLLLNGISYRFYSSYNQINEDVISLYESVSTASLLQHKIVSFYMETGRFPISNRDLGVGEPETFGKRAISKITIGAEGVIEISLQKLVTENDSIFLKPYLSYTGIGSEIDWQCFSYTVTQAHFDHGPLSRSCVYRQNKLPPPSPSQPSWVVTNSENFILAIHKKRRALILHMLGEGIDVNMLVNGELPLQAAIEENDYKIVKILIEAGANTNSLLKNNMSLLMFASARKNISKSIIDMLLRGNTDFTRKDSEGRTVLMYAAMVDNYYLTKLIIEAGVNIELVDNYGKPAAAYALENGGPNSSSYSALIRKQDLDAEFIYVLPEVND